MQPYLHCEDIIKIYPQKSKVKKATLRGIHLTVHKGEFISILGPSGCGKTTLLMIITGLLEPSAGFIKIEDHLINELSTKEKLFYYRKHIGLMLQNPRENVIWDLSVFDNVFFPIVLCSTHPNLQEGKTRVKTLLKQVDLETKASRKPFQLSGGELQRLSLAIALANNPDLLILDEPTSQLDTVNALKIVNYLRTSCDNLEKTIVMVTHDLRMVKKTDHCFIMKEGKMKEIMINGQNN
ncbi:MAG: ABC transporter ATP-binding protein [Promethearchaeota archaeon]